jgi:pilus assembly protein Flp/PilA
MLNSLMVCFQMLRQRLARDEEGQTLVEYALIIALVSVVLIGALAALAASIGGVFTNIQNSLGGV